MGMPPAQVRKCIWPGCDSDRPIGRSYRYCDEHRARPERTSYIAEWHREHPEARERHRLKSRYGITPEQRDAMIEAQGGRCACCGEVPDRWHIDHDHACCPGRRSCGRCVRGMVCARCNATVLPVVDNPGLLARGLAYVGLVSCS